MEKAIFTVYHKLKEALNHKGCDTLKYIFRVSDEVRFKPACSTTETSYKIEISLVASLDMTPSNKGITTKGITKALIRLGGCASWSVPLLFGNPRRQGFSCRGLMIFILSVFHHPLLPRVCLSWKTTLMTHFAVSHLGLPYLLKIPSKNHWHKYIYPVPINAYIAF